MNQALSSSSKPINLNNEQFANVKFEFRLSSPARRAVQAQLLAYNNGDIKAFADVYCDDIQLIDMETGGVFCSGKSELIERYGKQFAENPSLHCKLIKRTSFGNLVYDEESVIGHPAGAGKTVHAMATYLVNDEGLISKVWFAKEIQEK